MSQNENTLKNTTTEESLSEAPKMIRTSFAFDNTALASSTALLYAVCFSVSAL